MNSRQAATEAKAMAVSQVKLSSPIVLLDGGMGHLLKARGISISGPVGSMRRFLGVAMANIERPELVLEAHLAYIDAGATVVTTNSYACVPRCLEECVAKDGPTTVDLEALIRRSGELAREACRLREARGVRVAGCLPPLAESYKPEKVGEFGANLEQYRRIVAAIAPTSDLLLCETMSTAAEAAAAFTAAAESGLPVWVSWTLDEERPLLRSGETVDQAVAALLEVPGVSNSLEALLFNCTCPGVIREAMPLLAAAAPAGVRIGGYANAFVAKSGGEEYRDLAPEQYLDDYVRPWVAASATVVGGCCGVFPDHIRTIHDALLASDGTQALTVAEPSAQKNLRQREASESEALKRE